MLCVLCHPGCMQRYAMPLLLPPALLLLDQVQVTVLGACCGTESMWMVVVGLLEADLL